MLETQGQPQDPQEPQKRRPGPGPRGRTGPGPGTQAASFVVPGNPEATPGSPAYEHGFQVANLENLFLLYLKSFRGVPTTQIP